MIDGLRLDVSADEIVKLLEQRITEHRENADADEDNAKKLDALKRPDDLEDAIGALRIGDQILERAPGVAPIAPLCRRWSCLGHDASSMKIPDQ